MTGQRNADELDETLNLERQVWDALVAGDRRAHHRLLAPAFVGVYPTGIEPRAEPADPSTAMTERFATYRISEAQLVHSTDTERLIAYRATYRRTSGDDEEEMYVSSLWIREHDEWTNIFSQDTPIETTRT